MIRGTIVTVFCLLAPAVWAAPEGFEKWKADYVAEWGKREVPRSFMKERLREVEYNPKVVKIDRNQVTSSKKLDYREWIKGWLDSDPARVERGRELLEEHAGLLGRVESKFGVDKEAVVALWGVETLYGEHKGDYPVVQTLATLAFEGRRKRFFEVQLFTALKILHQGHISAEEFTGSWSGALGHCQFMPSSFTRLAVDFDGDGKKDIWNSLPDVFASIANYLRNAKWQKGKSVGALAYLKGERKFNRKRYRTPAQYNALGFRTAEGEPLSGKWKRKAEEIPHQNSPYVLRGSNYMPVMRWNNSSLFAALVITLMDAFEG